MNVTIKPTVFGNIFNSNRKNKPLNISKFRIENLFKMNKMIVTLCFVLAFVAFGYCDAKSLINLKRCPNYEPMPNVDLEKVMHQQIHSHF